MGALSGQIVWRFCFNSSKEFSETVEDKADNLLPSQTCKFVLTHTPRNRGPHTRHKLTLSQNKAIMFIMSLGTSNAWPLVDVLNIITIFY